MCKVHGNSVAWFRWGKKSFHGGLFLDRNDNYFLCRLKYFTKKNYFCFVLFWKWMFHSQKLFHALILGYALRLTDAFFFVLLSFRYKVRGRVDVDDDRLIITQPSDSFCWATMAFFLGGYGHLFYHSQRFLSFLSSLGKKKWNGIHISRWIDDWGGADVWEKTGIDYLF